MSDFFYLNEIAERIQKQRKPRLLYQKGLCASGTFVPYMNLADWTAAAFLSDPERETPVTVRFAKVFSKAGAADTKRDAVAFFVRFDTPEGRFDLLSHNLPLSDALKTPERIAALIEAFRRKNEDAAPEEEALFALTAEEPSFLPFLLRYFSDDATVKSYRGVDGFPLNGHVLTDRHGKRRAVDFFWRSLQKQKPISRQEAEFYAGYDENTALRDFADAIAAGQYPSFELSVRIRSEEETGGETAEELAIGKLTLRSLAADGVSEEIAFTPQNVVPGIALAPNAFNSFTAFAFNESARARGGQR